jgi:hypothetical protein
LGLSLQRTIRPLGFAVLIALVAAYGWIALRGPQGIPALLDKHGEIRHLQDENSAKMIEIERRKDHIRRLKESQSEQQMQIRKQLKLQREGETTFIIPDAPKSEPPAPDPQPQQER